MTNEHPTTPRMIRDCPVRAHDEVAPGQYRIYFEAPEMAQASAAGQFCMIAVTPGLYPFLRRPMCFERIYPDGFTILYKIEGEGTRLLAETPVGASLSIQGPLGRGFPIDPGYKRHIIVAGGIGVAPFPALADALLAACGQTPEVVLAARTKHLVLCEQEFKELGCTVHIATDDGSLGVKAYAADLFKRLSPGPDTRVYACGPMIMMQTTSDIASAAGASCLVSLEAQMACGDGACLGCVVESKLEHEGERMARVCLDGPVFDTRDIDWEAHDRAYAL